MQTGKRTPAQRAISDAKKEAAKSKPAANNKFNSVKTEVDGIVFHSKKEAKRYQELKILEKAGEISQLGRQVPYRLFACELGSHKKIEVCKYIADFVYCIPSKNETVVEDVKGARPYHYQIKKKMMKACYGIDIKET